MVAAEHINDEEVNIAVAIDVREIDPHRKRARVAQCKPRQSAEFSLTVIDPDAVRREQVVADVYVRRPVAVEVVKLRREAPVPRRIGQRQPIFIEERTVRERPGSEMSSAVVEIQNIRFAEFQHVTRGSENETIGVIRQRSRPVVHRRNHRSAFDQLPVELCRRFITDGVRAKVRDIQVQRAVTVHVRQRHRHAALSSNQPAVR